MVLNRHLIILITGFFIIYSIGIFYYFNKSLNESFALNQINSQKKAVSLALKYNKNLLQKPETVEKELLTSEYDFLNKQQAFIWLLESYQPKIKRNLLLSIAGFSVLLLLSILTIIYFSLRHLFSPLASVVNALDRYLNHEEIEKIPLQGVKKIRLFITQFNRIIVRLTNLRYADKVKNSFSSWQLLARMMGHEIKNRLSPLFLNLDTLILQFNDQPPLTSELTHIKENLFTLEKIVKSLNSLTSLPPPVCRDIVMDDFLNNLLKKSAVPEGSYLLSLEKKGLIIFSDPLFMEMIITNIILNAYQARKSDGFLVEVKLAADNKEKLIITDNGEGMDQKKIKKIFELGFTTKKTGSGVGMYLVRQLTDLLGYSLDIQSRPGKGTAVTIGF